MWFKALTGFREESPDQVRAGLVHDGATLTSSVNGRTMTCGRLETPTLGELRARAAGHDGERGRTALREVVGDVQALHADPAAAGALFQVASQFNLLEMTSPSVPPERGVGIYEHDYTQGPACAIAAGAGTIYRNYFADVGGQTGQSAGRQIDCLRDLGAALGNRDGRLWTMRNGYALATEAGLREITERLAAASDTERDALRDAVRIGVQWHTEVTLPGCGHLVTQAYCSALPVAYSPHGPDLWEAFGRLVLEAAYEATLWTAVLNHAATGHPTVYLTLLGGGAFGNPDGWIFDALERALVLFAGLPLDVAVVSYRASNPRVRALAASLR